MWQVYFQCEHIEKFWERDTWGSVRLGESTYICERFKGEMRILQMDLGVIGLILLMICLWLFPSLFNSLGGIYGGGNILSIVIRPHFVAAGACCVTCELSEWWPVGSSERNGGVILYSAYNRFGTLEKSVIHPVFTYLWASFHPLTPLFGVFCKVMKFSSNSVWKCRNSTFNAQAPRGIIVPVHVGAVKIYVTVVEALRKKERQGETQKIILMNDFLSFTTPPPALNANVLFCTIFSIVPCLWPNSGYWCCPVRTLRISPLFMLVIWRVTQWFLQL
jgi:hypothetical protein